MKIVLSRKGFDSSSGKHPSPILPDGTLLSIPIPENPQNSDAAVAYKQLLWQGRSYASYMRELGMEVPTTGAHVDPDLTLRYRHAPPGWQPLFGQANAAQRHLRNQGVAVGDIFLFFGWFRKTRLRQGKLCWDASAPPVHLIWGYLEIGHILDASSSTGQQFGWHPHLRAQNRPHNTVYIGRRRLSLAPQLPGASALTFVPELVLTAPQQSASNWILPAAFYDQDGRLSFHQAEERWSRRGESVLLRSVGRGQEFVVESEASILRWTKRIIETGMSKSLCP